VAVDPGRKHGKIQEEPKYEPEWGKQDADPGNQQQILDKRVGLLQETLHKQ
jgi:hypothetical protein